ncbi:hypothetical protein [Chryseobacterium sp. 5_R23647]|uniref:hypothetical protein n=1 Tax=Chryseobacterium sp. 5_R23647 TaxID=2258964 RepID=UPI000E24A57B|nr:hypothetical protein [Chryseobacterium sp. 5_R23647]REC41089.1 hypothetical protein DRF69_16140 [Chryseobacterium sp. 5_R23647]
MKKLFYGCGIFISSLYFSQEKDSKLNVSFFDGIVVAGYVDNGAYLNFTGPNVNFIHKSTKLMIGMLPSLRIKKDQSNGTKNSIIMPTLGVGFAVVYKKIALQIPFYYNTKTSTDSGSWKVGLGIGYTFK